MCGLDGRRLPRAGGAVVLFVVDAVRVRRASAPGLLRRHRGSDDHLLLLGRDGRSVLAGVGAIVGGGSAERAQRTEGVVDGLEAGGLGD